MKILYLDFDGVLIINGSISPTAFKNLNELLVQSKDLKIVVSSSWRHKGIKVVKKLLQDNGVEGSRIVGTTDLKEKDDRGHHIERHVQDHAPKDFVILDDHSDMDRVKDHLVQVNPYVGLTGSDIKKALAILNK
jgi:hypothetical protein